ncbi:MAG: efflux RND transporter permease subunit [Tepidisphaeraceae bacterium]
MSEASPQHEEHGGWINGIVTTFLHSNLSIILLVISIAVGVTALLITPREEDPQIVVPLADVYVSAPGMPAEQVERLVTTPLERILYQIDGVEYVYSMSHQDSALITVRFAVGQDRERSLVRLFKRLDENKDLIPPGVASWVMKPVEIDDVPVVTLTLGPAPDAKPDAVNDFTLRRTAEEVAGRLASVPQTSRVQVVGGLPRTINVRFDQEALASRGLDLLAVRNAIQAANVLTPSGALQRGDEAIAIRTGDRLRTVDEVKGLIVGVNDGRPVALKDVARVDDGPDEPTAYVRHGWGMAASHVHGEGATGSFVGEHVPSTVASTRPSVSAVTIAVAKQKGTNAVSVAQAVLNRAAELRRDLIPADMQLVVTRNAGLTADHKVGELVEGLWVAVVIVVALLTLGLGWRESLIVAVAVPVVFGLTLAVNMVAGYTVNRVTLFALILSLGLLVDDPIVDVENIARHFALKGKATRRTVLEAVSEIRPPLISATFAVIASFLPLFFITGMMGPYMRPMALNVPVTMVMSMLVAFTITPWLSYHLLKKRDWTKFAHHADEFAAARSTPAYRVMALVMRPLLASRWKSLAFLGVVGLLMIAASMLAAFRAVPLKMLPFDNKAELLLTLDAKEGTTLERTDALVADVEQYLAGVPEVTDYASYVGVSSPMDFNGLVRHYYLRNQPHQAEVRVNLVDKRSRTTASHGLGLRMRNELTAIVDKHNALLKIVELPPGPPVIDTVALEVYGRDDQPYTQLQSAALIARDRLVREPGCVEADTTVEADRKELRFDVDQEKALLSGVTVQQVAETVRTALQGDSASVLHVDSERQPLPIVLRLPLASRSNPAELARLQVRGVNGTLVPLAEIGRWVEGKVDQTIYHKNLERVAYVFAETAGRPPADVIVDVMNDQSTRQPSAVTATIGGWIDASAKPRSLAGRNHLLPSGGIPWGVNEGLRVVYNGEGEWKITLDVFRDLGLAFAAALVLIYIILVAQTGSFFIPLVVMLAIPLTAIGILPGFWLLGLLTGQTVGGYSDPVFFTATAMIGMIALSGIVTRQSIILVDFIHLCLKRGRSLFDAVLEAGAVRLRPILLVVLAALLSSIPITVDPIFSGLAWALIFGLIASTAFTLFVIPIVYYRLYANKPGHGLNLTRTEESTSSEGVRHA